jgi:hypothetical protein
MSPPHNPTHQITLQTPYLTTFEALFEYNLLSNFF